MRSLFLILLLANLVFFASQFDIVRAVVTGRTTAVRPVQINGERMRLVLEAATRRVTPAAVESTR